jgi:aldehyde dehydrogenase (NAD+)
MCHESKLNTFIDSFKKQLEKGYNNCTTPAESGKMINEFHLKRVCSLLENHGGEVIIGNENAHLDFNLKPTIVLNPSKNSRLMNEEIFGPIFPIILYTNID